MFEYYGSVCVVAHLMHVHELAAYCYVLFMFYEPLVAVPFCME